MNLQLPAIVRSLVTTATLATVAVSATAQDVVGDMKAGQNKAEMCIGCHGIPGYQNSFPEVHKVPKISGQSDRYIIASLTAYKKGDRRHPTMRGIAGTLTEQDMADLAAFYAGQVSEVVPEVPRAANVAAAALIEKGACASCHGANFSKPIDPSYPKLAGQHADYLYVALKAYTVESNSVIGRNNAIMSGIAKQYSHAEMRVIAKYLASIDSEMAVVPQQRFK